MKKMTTSTLKWLVVIQLLLNEQALCRIMPPLVLKNAPLPDADVQEETKTSLLESPLSSTGKPSTRSKVAQKEEKVQSAKQMILILREKLQGQIPDPHFQGNVSCEELLSASTMDDQLPVMLPQELLGLSLVPVLVMAGCPKEAQTLVLKLYDLLGVADAEDLLMEVQGLTERRMMRSGSTTAPAAGDGRHMEAVMFNIHQLATVGERRMGPDSSLHCEGWTRLNGTVLLGTSVQGSTGELKEALSSCERLGVLCAGVNSFGPTLGKYQAVLKRGSHVLPSESSQSECWIQQCSDEDISLPLGKRMRRTPHKRCINTREERVYNVIEWIPGVSTLYNLGTAVYYASVNCSETAKERAILTAVDIGTDALMVVTGGTAGVAGYAIGAGVKTGVKASIKYLLSSIKQEEDVVVNQRNW